MAKGRRRLQRVLIALAILLSSTGLQPRPVEASALDFPVLNIGSRGTDVRAVQYLLRNRGYQLPPTGFFGPMTRDAVSRYQRARGLSATGRVDPATWGVLVTPVHYGERSEAVKAVQVILREKRDLSLPVIGVYGPQTRSAMMSFESRYGLPVDGNVGVADWRSLARSFERPKLWLPQICPYGPGGAAGHSGHWGTSNTIAQVTLAALAVHGKGLGPVAIGDISLERGGAIPGHVTHRQGMDVDLRPMRRGGNQCQYPVTWYRMVSGVKVCCHPSYDRDATRALIQAIRAASRERIQVIAFNDPQLIREGLAVHVAGHDDHLHVRYCESGHPDPLYRCGR
jgi:peptidoglycan hydrolase-like protein with peptidoglycan-binding domain